MLTTILDHPFVPGSNRQGRGIGAGWAFVLAGLDAGKVVCIGHPGDDVLVDLGRFSNSIVIWCRSDGERDRLTHGVSALGLQSAISLVEADSADTPEDWADVVFVAGRRASAQLGGTPSLRSAVERVLAPHGSIWVGHDRSGSSEPGQRFWITPFVGPMQTAVPSDDPVAVRYFVDHGLDKTWATVDALRKVLRRRPRGKRGSAARGAAPPRTTPASGYTRRIGRSLVSILQIIERSGARIPILRRRALLVSRLGPVDPGPPKYLQELARSCGVDIGHYRWGLSAGGEYPSRKVVCYLLDPDSGRLRHLIKLTRDPAFNHRLEIEHQGLLHLHSHSAQVGVGVPRPSFFGHHRGRAILGQSALLGEPFNERTRHTPDCPVAGAVVVGLTRLGAATASSREPSKAAARLEGFADRFMSLYQPSDQHAAFLLDQIRSLSSGAAKYPVVFQHGDTHPGNILHTGPGAVGLVDWEASDPEGLPLWDVFHFLWAYISSSSQARNVHTQVQCFERHFFEDSGFHRLVLDSVAHYCREVGIQAALIEPLFYTGWMYRAIRESVRLEPDHMEEGRYVRLLRLCIDERQREGLQRLFRGGEFA